MTYPEPIALLTEVRLSAQATRAMHIGVAGPCSPRAFAADLGMAPDALPRGLGGTPINHLVRAWLHAGHCVTLTTLDRAHEAVEPAVYRGARLTLAVGPYRPRHRARDAFAAERNAIKVSLARENPEAISAHWSYEFALGAIETRIPTLVTVRDVPREVFRMQPSPYRLVRWWMHRKALKGAARVAFNSPYTQRKLGHRSSEGSVVLPNAIPDALLHLKRRHVPKPKAPRFISVNNGFGDRKNVYRLLEAFSSVVGRLPNARLQLVGHAFEPDGSAMGWAESRSLTRGVDFAGPQEYGEVLKRIEAADVLVHPSLEESFGYTLLEAASVGTPVIAGRESGAVPWVLDGGAGGVLVDVRSSDAIASAMVELVTSPDIWSRLRTQAHELARERFAASRIAANYAAVLAEIAR